MDTAARAGILELHQGLASSAHERVATSRRVCFMRALLYCLFGELQALGFVRLRSRGGIILDKDQFQARCMIYMRVCSVCKIN